MLSTNNRFELLSADYESPPQSPRSITVPSYTQQNPAQNPAQNPPVEYTPNNYKTSVCRHIFGQNGKRVECSRNRNGTCSFAHYPHELKAPKCQYGAMCRLVKISPKTQKLVNASPEYRVCNFIHLESENKDEFYKRTGMKIPQFPYEGELGIPSLLKITQPHLPDSELKPVATPTPTPTHTPVLKSIKPSTHVITIPKGRNDLVEIALEKAFEAGIFNIQIIESE